MKYELIRKYLITIYYLKCVQIYYRIKYLIYKPVIKKLKKVSIVKLDKKNKKELTFHKYNKSHFADAKNFSALNKSIKINFKTSWKNQKHGKLWLYNLHYFDFLNSKIDYHNTEFYLTVIDKWIDNNPDENSIGWDAYPISLRLVNIIKFLIQNQIDNKKINMSIFSQAHILSKKLDKHILGNHLIANAKALIFAGFYFDDLNGERFFSKGINLLMSEINLQILDDGGHFELSPMYHNIILNDLLDIIKMMQIYNFQKNSYEYKTIVYKVKKMTKWMMHMQHTDGSIPFFNDAAFGIAPNSSSIAKFIKSLEIKVPLKTKKNFIKYLQSSGYASIKDKELRLIMDVGNLGPDFLLAHAHADTLSFEMSLYGNKLIVNGGTSSYDLLKDREIERSSKSHSTITVNNNNSSDTWNYFRVAKRAKIKNVKLIKNSNLVEIRGEHNGYNTFFSKNIVSRKLSVETKKIKIHDKVSKLQPNTISKLILHPNVKIIYNDKKLVKMKIGKSNVVNFKILKGSCSVKNDKYRPEFGKKMKTKSLNILFHKKECLCNLTW